MQAVFLVVTCSALPRYASACTVLADGSGAPPSDIGVTGLLGAEKR